MSIKFISFLGTGTYKKASYSLNSEVVNDVKFVQEALVRMCCKDFKKDDSLCFLLTNEAKNVHWNSTSKEDDSLKNIINATCAECNITANIKPIDIPSGKNEKEIWKIFQSIYDLLEVGDSVIFDITHSFRSLPMLCFAVLNYASYLKHIQVEAIYYGAFDARETNTNVTPVFNLFPFFSLMQWGSAADAFVNYGYTDKLEALVGPTAREHHGSKKIVSSISDTTNDLHTVRGGNITDGTEFKRCIVNIDKLKENANLSAHPAFKPFFEQIKNELTPFKEKSTLNFLYAAKLNLKHGREQQAITLLQEGIITVILNKLEQDWTERILREICSWAINSKIKEMNTENEELREVPEKYSKQVDLIEKIKNDDFLDQIYLIFNKLTTLRNDVNHGGYNKSSIDSKKIIGNVNKYYEEIAEICKTFFAY